MKKLLYLFIGLFASFLLYTCVTDDNVNNEEYEIGEPVVRMNPDVGGLRNRCLDRVSKDVFAFAEQSFRGNGTWWFRYSEINNNNCEAKFIGKDSMTFANDSLCLCKVKQVGNAFYVLDDIDNITVDSATYHYLQGRETYRGVYNNNPVCDFRANLFKFHMKVRDTLNAANIGDTIYLGHH